MRLRLPHLALCLVVFAPAVFAAPNETVNRTSPPVYAEQLAPLLTPLAEVLAGQTAFPEDKTGGVILLTEAIRYRGEDGLDYRLSHTICTAMNQAGVEPLGNDTFTYDRERESIFLIEAATILPDGTRVPIEEKGAFIQTPQHEAQNSLYTSQAELHLVYPKIAPGATTEVIVLVRENVPVMPGEFSGSRTFGAGWPTYRHRYIVDLPKAEWEHISFAGTSAGVPEPTVAASGPDRERRVWLRDRITATPWEYYSPDFAFRAPTLWMTTLRSWDDLARWYAGQVEKASTVGPELAAAIDRATKGLKKREEIVEALLRLAAEEVRYTGLEFGLAGYCPHSCDDVWKQRYGDCKDKSTLLRAMLARKNIPAHLVLLDTRNGGKVEKANPSWRQFNHAILAIENERGAGFLFCDPTAKHLTAGTVGMNDVARDVLVLRGERAEWVAMPDRLEASITYSADLAFSAEGELSGWFEIRSRGSDAAYFAEFLNGLDRQGLQKRMQEYVEAFFAGADVVDVDYKPVHGAIADLSCRAFFLRRARNHAEATLPFPYPAGWVPMVNNDGERRFPYFTTRREVAVEVSIALAPGWSLATQPEEFSAPSPVATANAAWHREGDRLTASLLFRPEHAEIAPADFAVFQRSCRALLAWMERPVVFSKNAAATAAPDKERANAPALENFPVLPSASGQFRLLDERFPENSGKDAQRRAALAKILQWFPQDLDAVFQAKLQTADLDFAKDERAFAETAAKLLQQYRSKLSAGIRSWGEFREATARWHATKNPAALAKLQELARDESLTPYRRGWAAHAAGLALLETKPRDAAAFLASMTELDCEAKPRLLNLAACAYARAGDTKALQRWLPQVAARNSTTADQLLAGMLKALFEERPKIDAADQPKIAAAFAAALGGTGAFPQAAVELERFSGALAADSAQKQFVAKLGEWLRAHPPAWWTKTKSPLYNYTGAIVARIEEENKKPDAKVICDLILQLMLHHEPDYPTFAKYSNWLIWYLDTRQLNDPLLEAASTLALNLPAGPSEEIVEAWLVRAAFLRRTGKLDESRALYTRLLEGEDARDYQKVAAGGEFGLLEFQAGRVEEALAVWKRIEPLHTRHKHGIDYLYPELLVLLDRGEFDRGLEIVGRIKEQDSQWIEAAWNAAPLQSLLQAYASPAGLKRYWEQAARTKSAWEALLAANGVTPNPLPDRLNVPSVIERARKAAGARDRATYLAQLDLLMRTARCVPLCAIDAAMEAIRVESVSKELVNPVYDCVLPLFADLAPIEPGFDAKARIWEAYLLSNRGRKEESAAKAEAAYRDLGPKAALGNNALRIWAVAVRQSPAEPKVLGVIHDLLAGDGEVADRLDLVRVYSDSLQLRGDRAEHLALLQRETARAGFNAKSDDGGVLVARLEQLRRDGAVAEAFGAFVEKWCSLPERRWLEQLQPASLDEARFATRREPMTSSENGYSESERLKFNLLLARDPAVETSKRETAFCEVVWETALATNDYELFTAQILAAASDEGLTGDNRRMLLRLLVWQSAVGLRPDILDRAVAHPLFADHNADYRQSVTALQKALRLLASDEPDRRSAAFAALLDAPLDSLRDMVATTVLQSLALDGDAAKADALVAGASQLTVAPRLEKSPAAIRLSWTRAIRLSREMAPFVAKLREMVERLPGAQAECTPRARNLMRLSANVSLTTEEQVALAGAFLRRWDRPALDLHSALDLPRAALASAGRDRFAAIPLLEVLVSTPITDGLRSSLLPPTTALLDLDDPEVRAAAEKALAPLLTSAAMSEQPASASAAAMLRARSALRSSDDPRPAALFDPVQTKMIPPQLLPLLQLHFQSTRGQFPLLTASLDAADPTLIAEYGMMDFVQPVLQNPDRATERQLYEEAAAGVYGRRLNDAWHQVQSTSHWGAALHPTAATPADRARTEAWYDYALPFVRNELERARLGLARARFHRDWSAVKGQASELLRHCPTMYDVYLDRAQAEESLGERVAAKQDYDTFLNYCRDNPYYQGALKALQALDAQH
ncbi:MAG TPA: DUF3857 domain-containing protein [Opitutaceae bacterium]|nr:DUF3857 domain-containing protein [Opitutaceae bacterium]